jgi:tetratricopeptide (TPR) repeat protein
MRFCFCVMLTAFCALAPRAAQGAVVSEPAETAAEPSPAEKELQALVARQQELLGRRAKADASFDEENFRTAMQQLCNDYDDYLKKHKDYAPGYAAYGVLLGKVDMRRQSAVMLLKANQLFGAASKEPAAATPAFVRTWALVKNQLGNYLAEEGKPLEAVNYFLSAIQLTPNEPLYHYQLGTLLTEARDDFLKSGQWEAAAVNRSMHQAFRRAAELAPDRIEFTYRYAESFYDLDPPDWDGALKAWDALEQKATNEVERQTMRLHRANVLIKQKQFEPARAALATVTEGTLQKQKEKLVAQLPGGPAK